MTASSGQPPTEHVWLPPQGEHTWWSRYEGVLAKSVGAKSREVIGRDADFIVERCILAPQGGDAESSSRERRGAVMGAVQSGKTASMMAVIAKSLDANVDAVVVLAGTRTALWMQTWERVLAQLDTFEDQHLRRVLIPSSAPDAAPDVSSGLYELTRGRAERSIKLGRPIVVIAMKQVAHLERVARTLHDAVYPVVHERGEPFHLVVLDDEADDSSIDEIDLTSSAGFQERQVPRRIVDLWESRQLPGQTAIPELRATYIAYTATPQANFLQDQSNPLAPKDFVVCLRTPGADGEVEAREPSYRVPEGLPGWYTGGDVYYKTLATVPLCVATDAVPEGEVLPHGVRGYLVASAVRLARARAKAEATSQPGPSLVGSVGKVFESAAQAKAASGAVMSMLVHPSAGMDDHFDTAHALLEWSAGLAPGQGAVRAAQGDWSLGRDGIEADMDAHAEAWEKWLSDYEDGSKVVQALDVDGPVFPDLTWNKVRGLVLDEIVPVTSVAVINSDVRAADRPIFDPVGRGDEWRVAPNLSTIFVSGNVMSRGLTLEGLTTTLFTRRAGEPASDTQMQMQRWFGYRGTYIDVCRVLMPAQQIGLFSSYHETDLALRLQVLEAMTADEPASPTVLQGRDFKATAKIRNVRGRSLWPGHEPFTTWLNPPEADEVNQQVVADLFADDWTEVSGGRGLLLDRHLSMTEVASVLNSLRYPAVGGGGGIDVAVARQWEAVEDIAQLDETDPFHPMYTMPAGTDPALWGAGDPYSVAAYLKFWALCLQQRCPATTSTDEPPQLWSTIDLEARAAQQPTFRVGLRFGAGQEVTNGPLTAITTPVRSMGREVVNSRLKATWGSRQLRAGKMWGDEHFDRYDVGQLPELAPSGARQRGEDGLLLFHVIQAAEGAASIAPALAIPLGGPDQVHAVKG